MPKCVDCGAVFPDATRFCPECGVRVEGTSKPVSNPAMDRNAGLRDGSISSAVSGVMQPPTNDTDSSDADAPVVTSDKPNVPLQPLETILLPEGLLGHDVIVNKPESTSAATPFPSSSLSYAAEVRTQDSVTGTGANALAQSTRTLWLILGSVGCLVLILVGSSMGLLFFFVLGNADNTISSPVHPQSTLSVPTLSVPTLSVPTLSAPTPLTSSMDVRSTSATVTDTLLLQDDFTLPTNSSLGSDEDDEARYYFADGAYFIEVKEPQLVAWSQVDGVYVDVSVQVDMTLIEGATSTAGGLIFRYQDDRNFYLFNVAYDGFYKLEMMQNNEWKTLIDWTPLVGDTATNKVNTLRVETQGERITLFVNGVLLEETADTTFMRGEVALVVNTFDAGKASVRFDNLIITANK